MCNVLRAPSYCSSCIEFDIGEAAKGDGTATCRWFGTNRWDDRACVLYTRDKHNLAKRKKWVLRLMETHPSTEEK